MTIAFVHIAALYGFARLLVPDSVAMIENSALSALSLLPEEAPRSPLDPQPSMEEVAAAGEAAKAARSREIAMPRPKVKLPKIEAPAPAAQGIGEEVSSGASKSGEGSGAGDQGVGAGQTGDGDGMGGGMARKAQLISGSISKSSDYPVPPGGRQARVGTSVIIAIQVGADGTPTGCSVYRPGPFPETNSRTCELAMQRFKFEPARGKRGEAIASVFHYKQDFFN